MDIPNGRCTRKTGRFNQSNGEATFQNRLSRDPCMVMIYLSYRLSTSHHFGGVFVSEDTRPYSDTVVLAWHAVYYATC